VRIVEQCSNKYVVQLLARKRYRAFDGLQPFFIDLQRHPSRGACGVRRGPSCTAPSARATRRPRALDWQRFRVSGSRPSRLRLFTYNLSQNGIIVRVMTNVSIYLEVLWVFVCLEPSAMRAGRVYQQLYEHVVPGFHTKGWERAVMRC
jgi:hypothetical protein